MSKFIPNSTQVPNAVIDEIMLELSDSAFKCYVLIIRKTVGWHKEQDGISISQFMKLTGKSKNTVIKNCKELVDCGLIEKTGKSHSTSVYKLNQFNICTSSKNEQEVVQNMNGGSSKNEQEVVQNMNTQKQLTKTTKQKQSKYTPIAPAEQIDEKSDYEIVLEKIKVLGDSIPQAFKISEKREKAIKGCLKNYGLDGVLAMLDKTAKSPLTDESWFDFDFMWRDTQQSPRFLNILEGKYDESFAVEKKPSKEQNNISDNFEDYESPSWGATS